MLNKLNAELHENDEENIMWPDYKEKKNTPKEYENHQKESTFVAQISYIVLFTLSFIQPRKTVKCCLRSQKCLLLNRSCSLSLSTFLFGENVLHMRYAVGFSFDKISL